MLLGLNTMKKVGLFIRNLRVSTETSDIHQGQQNQARYDPMEVESTIREEAAGPAAEPQCSRPADYTPINRKGYVNPQHIRRTKLIQCHCSIDTWGPHPAIKFPAKSEVVKVSPQVRQDTTGITYRPRASKLLPRQPVRLQDPQTKKLSTRRQAFPGLRPPIHMWLKHQKVLVKEIRCIQGTKVTPKPSTRVQESARTTDMHRIAANTLA